MGWKQLFFGGNGRIGRRDFWIASMLLGVICAPLRMFGAPGVLLTMIFLFPHICIISKRLHDLGRSGWLAGIPFCASLIGALLAGGDPDAAAGGPAPWSQVAFLVAALAFFLWVGLSKGRPTPNRYGERQVSFLTRADENAGRPA